MIITEDEVAIMMKDSFGESIYGTMMDILDDEQHKSQSLLYEAPSDLHEDGACHWEIEVHLRPGTA